MRLLLALLVGLELGCQPATVVSKGDPARPPIRAAVPLDTLATLTGFVKDDSTSAPAASVIVAVRAAQIGTYTDSLGAFTLRVPPGHVVIELLRIGYKRRIDTLVVEAGGTRNLNYRLQRDTIRLSEVSTCDPTVVTVELVVTGAATRFRYAIISATSQGRALRDSIPASALTNGRTRRSPYFHCFWTDEIDIEVRAPGYRRWSRSRAPLGSEPIRVELRPAH